MLFQLSDMIWYLNKTNLTFIIMAKNVDHFFLKKRLKWTSFVDKISLNRAFYWQLIIKAESKFAYRTKVIKAFSSLFNCWFRITNPAWTAEEFLCFVITHQRGSIFLYRDNLTVVFFLLISIIISNHVQGQLVDSFPIRGRRLPKQQGRRNNRKSGEAKIKGERMCRPQKVPFWTSKIPLT